MTRNDYSDTLQPFINHIFVDLVDGSSKLDLLQQCYVIRKQYKDVGADINQIFDVPPAFANPYNVRSLSETLQDAGNFQYVYKESENFLRNNARGSLIVLMGGVGCGKTTFIHHFFNFVLAKPEKRVWFYASFFDVLPRGPLDVSSIENHIYESIIREFYVKYADKFFFNAGLNNAEMLNADFKTVLVLFSSIMREGYTIAVVLDNADQHSVLSPKYQEGVLAVAKFLTESLKCVVILALREESFFKSMRSGVLTAFPVPPYHISSPNFDILIQSRLEYVLNILVLPDKQISKLLNHEVDLGPLKELVKLFFEIVSYSLNNKRSQGREILKFFDDVSGGDMRLALRYFRAFVSSGNTDIREMIEKEKEERRYGEHYEIPFHHFVKSIILQQSRIFATGKSPILNLFDFNQELSDSYFLNLRILNYLYNRIGRQTSQGRGFVEIASIISEAERVNISQKAIEYSINNMVDYGLIQFENQAKDNYYRPIAVSITNTGIYYLNELSRDFVYLDLVWMDTPLTDNALIDFLLARLVETNSAKTENDLYTRFERTEAFINHLKVMEINELRSKPEYKFSELTNKEFMPEIIEAYIKKKNAIIARGNKH